MHSTRLRLIAAGAALALTGSAAAATELSIADPEGDQLGPMSFDIASASHGHSDRTEQYPRFLSHAVAAADPVTDAVLHEEEVQFRFNFDVTGNGAFDRSIVIDYAPGDVRADMWRGAYPAVPDGSYEPADWVGFVEVARPDDHTVQVLFPRRLLGRALDRGDAYRWMVEVYRLPGWNSWCADGDVSPCYDKTSRARHRL